MEVGYDISTTLNSTQSPPDLTTTPYVDKYQQLKIISSVAVVAVLALVCGIACLLYRKICKSNHFESKHGVEREVKGAGKEKVEYYDQFGCDTNELTVNSVTALTWDEDESKLTKLVVKGGSRSSGIDCDMNSDDAKEEHIDTGNRVFHVNKVSEKSRRRLPPGQVTVRLHKGIASAARSLQASDGQNYTLALIDRNTQTIHNIDLGGKRSRTRGRSPLAGDGQLSPQKVRLSANGRRRRATAHSDTNGQMIHDSPDAARKIDISPDELSEEVLSESSTTTGNGRSLSISSKESGYEIDSTAQLLPASNINSQD